MTRMHSPHAPEFTVRSLPVREAMSAERLEELRAWVANAPHAAPGTHAAGLRDLLSHVDWQSTRIAELETALDGHWPRVNHEDVAEQARSAPGTWPLVGRYRSYDSARQIASKIRTGKLPAYQPRGAFRSRVVSTVTRHEVFVCFVGDQAAEVTG